MTQTFWDSFGLVGAAWLFASAMAGLLFTAYLFIPLCRRPGIARAVLALAIVGLFVGAARSERVDMIQLAEPKQPDPQAIDPAKAAELARRASSVRFAEDSQLDRLDIAGASQSELAPAKPTAPQYAYQQRGKQTRDTGQTINRLDDLKPGGTGLDGEASTGEAAEDKAKPAAPLLTLEEPYYSRVKRFDHLALSLAKGLLWAGILLVLGDFIARQRAGFAQVLPVAPLARLSRVVRPDVRHAWVNRGALNGHPLGALAAIRAVQKDGTCLYIGQTPAWSGRSVPRHVIPSNMGRLPSLTYTGEAESVSKEFAAESLWYGTGCVTTCGAARGREVIDQLVTMIRAKELTDCPGRRLIQVVWDLPEQPGDETLLPLLEVAWRTNIQVLLICDEPPAGVSAKKFAEGYEGMPQWDLSATATERALMWLDDKVVAKVL